MMGREVEEGTGRGVLYQVADGMAPSGGCSKEASRRRGEFGLPDGFLDGRASDAAARLEGRPRPSDELHACAACQTAANGTRQSEQRGRVVAKGPERYIRMLARLVQCERASDATNEKHGEDGLGGLISRDGLWSHGAANQTMYTEADIIDAL